MIERIDGALFCRMVEHGSACISARKQEINELNVFPVPDGDTGTNMAMTIGTAAEEFSKKSYATWARRPTPPPTPCSGGPGGTRGSSSPCCSGALPRP